MTQPRESSIELLLFTTDFGFAELCVRAGISGVVIDWEYRGKAERQRAADTEINRDTADDLAVMRGVRGARRVCRINAPGPWTAGEVDLAIECGATDLLLPMVSHPGEVEDFLRRVDRRCRAGILVETRDACATALELAKLPLDLVYVGLNDLAISRGSRSIFAPLVDGLALGLRECFASAHFGMGGLTLVDRGRPIPCLVLMAELARHGCDFTFLRRSFKRDIRERGLGERAIGGRGRAGSTESGNALSSIVADIQAAWAKMRSRGPAEIERDHQVFRGHFERSLQAPEPD
jgi:hypothetical protein